MLKILWILIVELMLCKHKQLVAITSNDLKRFLIRIKVTARKITIGFRTWTRFFLAWLESFLSLLETTYVHIFCTIALAKV